MSEHWVIEMMASSWDELGHRPPRNWRWVCSCGTTERNLPDQITASDSWRQHRSADR